MKQVKKRIGSLLIIVCMVLTMLPTVAFAEEGIQDSGTALGTSEITAAPILRGAEMQLLGDSESHDITEKFTDNNFRALVYSTIKKIPPAVIYDTDVSTLEEFNVTDSNIESLAGIEYFTGLTTLNVQCKESQLNYLDVSKNTLLSKLNCTNSKLTNLDVSKNTELNWLSCINSQLEELDVSNNTKLNILACFNNELAKLDVSKNTKLTNLSCANNQLTKLDVSNNLELSTNLSCANNQLSELDVSKNTKLTNLSCANNQLTKLDVSNNPELSNLSCDNNQLSKLDLSKNIKLYYLNCNSNKLSELDVRNNSRLNGLFCKNNQLKGLEVSNNTALTTLNCSNNYMTDKSAVKGLDTRLTKTFYFDPQNTVPTTYSITVNNGTASPTTAEKDITVTITAGTAPSGKRFKEWTVVSGDVTLSNAKASSTTFKMPTNAVVVTATYEDIPAGVTSVTGVTLNKTAISLYSNTNTKTANLTATIAPSDATDKSVTWQSNNASVATVDANGLVTAVGNGSAIITVTTTDGGYTASCTVTVSTYSSGGSHSGGGHSSGGGSITPATPATTVSGSTATTETKAETDANGKATASVTQSQMNNAMEEAQKAAEKTSEAPKVKIEIGGASNAKQVKATLPKASVQKLATEKMGSLAISSAVSEMTFDKKALEKIASQTSGDVSFGVSKVDNSTLSEKARGIVGDRPIYDFSVTSGDKKVTEFDGTVTVSIPYTPAAGENPNAIVAYYINADGEPELMENCKYDAEHGVLVFTTTHFSVYAVGYQKVAFDDVKASAWYADAVTFLAARNITGGITETTFGPNETLTRGQFITLLMRAYNLQPDDNSNNNFSDAGDTYYTNYLAAAKQLGITGGVGDNKFAPEQAVTRDQMFTLLYNALKGMDQLPKGNSKKTLTDFTDSDRISSYAKDAMIYFVETGAVSGTNGKLLPEETTTRGEMAQVLYNLLAK